MGCCVFKRGTQNQIDFLAKINILKESTSLENTTTHITIVTTSALPPYIHLFVKRKELSRGKNHTKKPLIVKKRFIMKYLQTGFDLVEDDDTYDLITEWQQHKREAKMCRTASLKSRLLQGSKMFKASINK